MLQKSLFHLVHLEKTFLVDSGKTNDFVAFLLRIGLKPLEYLPRFEFGWRRRFNPGRVLLEELSHGYPPQSSGDALNTADFPGRNRQKTEVSLCNGYVVVAQRVKSVQQHFRDMRRLGGNTWRIQNEGRGGIQFL